MRRAELLDLKKKYQVTESGNMREIANALFNVRGRGISRQDLASIVHLLDSKNKRQAQSILSKAEIHDVQDFRGLWKKQPKALGKMTRSEIVRELRGFRNAWEQISNRSVDLDDERLASESTETLRQLVSFYYSDQGKRLAEIWINKTLNH